MINKVLTHALQLWLRTQVEQVERLQVKVTGESRQILGGYIPGVFLSASEAVYQGLHFSEVEVVGKNIRFNLAEVLKRQPLRVLETIPVYTEVLLTQADLQASLESALLANALSDLLVMFLRAGGKSISAELYENCLVSWQKVVIHTDKLIFQGQIIDDLGKQTPILLCGGLELANCHQLRLHPVHIDTSNSDLGVCLDEYVIDLGTEVEIEQLSLSSGQLLFRGGLTVIPE